MWLDGVGVCVVCGYGNGWVCGTLGVRGSQPTKIRDLALWRVSLGPPACMPCIAFPPPYTHSYISLTTGGRSGRTKQGARPSLSWNVGPFLSQPTATDTAILCRHYLPTRIPTRGGPAPRARTARRRSQQQGQADPVLRPWYVPSLASSSSSSSHALAYPSTPHPSTPQPGD